MIKRVIYPPRIGKNRLGLCARLTDNFVWVVDAIPGSEDAVRFKLADGEKYQ